MQEAEKLTFCTASDVLLLQYLGKYQHGAGKTAAQERADFVDELIAEEMGDDDGGDVTDNGDVDGDAGGASEADDSVFGSRRQVSGSFLKNGTTTHILNV